MADHLDMDPRPRRRPWGAVGLGGGARLLYLARRRQLSLPHLATPIAPAGGHGAASSVERTAAGLARATRLARATLALGVVGACGVVLTAAVEIGADEELREVGVTTVGTVLRVDPDGALSPGGASVRSPRSGTPGHGTSRSAATPTTTSRDRSSTWCTTPPSRTGHHRRRSLRAGVDGMGPRSLDRRSLDGRSPGRLAAEHPPARTPDAEDTSVDAGPRPGTAGRGGPLRLHHGRRSGMALGAVQRLADAELGATRPFGVGLPDEDPADVPYDQPAWWVCDGYHAVFSPDQGDPLVLARRRR